MYTGYYSSEFDRRQFFFLLPKYFWWRCTVLKLLIFTRSASNRFGQCQVGWYRSTVFEWSFFKVYGKPVSAIPSGKIAVMLQEKSVMLTLSFHDIGLFLREIIIQLQIRLKNCIENLIVFRRDDWTAKSRAFKMWARFQFQQQGELRTIVAEPDSKRSCIKSYEARQPFSRPLIFFFLFLYG